MCRIAGIIDKQRSSVQLHNEIKAMCESMKHGGPDDEGFFVDEKKGLAFGHRRLAIIDLSPTGHQPMFYNEQKLVITFNGEIYNYLELKAELSLLGFKFTTQSDTELILASYQAWGTASFNRLKGMFAFAIYDQLLGNTYLVRDPSGIKPLYYCLTDQQLVFASEVKAFKQIDLSLSENPNWKIYFLAFGHLPEPYTTFTEVLMLPKGNYLSFDHISDQHSIINFTIHIKTPFSESREEAALSLEKSLMNAVENHLLSDAPIGVFLSGGIDSSILSIAAAEKLTSRKVNTLSINFEECQFSEQPFQNLIKDQIKSDHSEYLITETIFNNLFPTALAANDQPSMDGINSWFVNYFAKQKGLKAVLSGIGGDELFGGYPSFKRMKMVRGLVKLPRSILKKGILFTKPALKRSYYLSYKNSTGKYLFLRGIYAPDEISQILDLPIHQVDEILKAMIMPEVPANLSTAQEAGWLELNFYMQNQLLKDTDAMSMQHGVEVRVPFLDQDLMQLLNNMLSDIRFQQQKPKGFLIDAFRKILPEAIWNRKKMGFTFPFQTWLRTNDLFLEGIKTDNSKTAKLKADFVKGDLHWSKAMVLCQINNFDLSPRPAEIQSAQVSLKEESY